MHNRKSFLLSIVLSCLFSLQIYAQIEYSIDIDQKIKNMAIDIRLPEDEYFNIHPSDVAYFPNFDLELLANSKQYEIRAIFDPIRNNLDFRNNVPHDFQRTIAQISNNNIEHNIEITGYTPAERKKVNVDWAMKADFIPKADFSDFTKIRMHYLYKESRGSIIYVILYANNTPIPSKAIFAFKK